MPIHQSVRVGVRHEVFGLLAIVAVAATVALWWAYRVPFFQEPDELAHTDYVLTMFNAGTNFVVRDGRPENEVAPQTRYLERVVDYRAMRYNPRARAPAGYGSPAFFSHADAAAPAPTGHVPRRGDAIPYVMGLYPFTFYALQWAALTAVLVFSHSTTGGFFAMRAVGVALLCVTLICTYLALRRYDHGMRVALPATLAVGIFPLTISMSSAVQPDTLVSTFMALVILGAASLRKVPTRSAGQVMIAIALTGLAMTKQHYAAAAWIATMPLVALARRPRTNWWRVGATGLLPLAGYTVATFLIGPVRGIESPMHFMHRTQTAQHAASVPLSFLSDAIRSSVDGTIEQGFWLNFGFRGAQIFAQPGVAIVFSALTIATCALIGITQARILRRIAIVCVRRSATAAVALLARGHALNLYLAVTTMLIVARAATSGAVDLQARYWLPVLPALVIVILGAVPRRIPRLMRRRVVTVTASTMAAYGVVAATSATLAMERNYYGPPSRPEFESVADVTSPTSLVLTHPGSAVFDGYAIDMLTGLPARTLYAQLDDTAPIAARATALPSPEVSRVFNDERVADAGFRIVIAHVRPGHHAVRFYVGRPGSGDDIPMHAVATIDVRDVH